MNPFHLVEKRPWPIVSSIGSLVFMFSIIISIYTKYTEMIFLSLMLLIISSINWWKDIFREASLIGEHIEKITDGLKIGMALFITSEVFFFISFFWAFFHRRIAPTVELGFIWPPKTIEPFDPIRVPLINTIILLSSGISITWSHHELINRNLRKVKKSLRITILLGLVFSIIQWIEYVNAPFRISDSVAGTTFFIMTGFHGIHVIIGTLFLITSLKRIKTIKNSSEHFLVFEISAWYWHFVDVVWLFLYMSIYWWGM